MYTAGKAAFDLAVLAGLTLMGMVGGYYWWSHQGVESGCAPSGALCE